LIADLKTTAVRVTIKNTYTIQIMRVKQENQTTDFLSSFCRYLKISGSEVHSTQVENPSSGFILSKKYLPSRNLAELPDDILAILFEYLLPADIIRCELVCRRFRSLIVEYSIYKVLLDSICKRKKINNYMALSCRAKEVKTQEERSQYYKYRLYHYTNKFKLRYKETNDTYIETYKVGRRKAELERLVEMGMKRFSLVTVRVV